MKIKLDAIRSHVNSYHVSPNAEVEEIKYFTDPKNRDDLEDKAAQLIILTCKAPSMGISTKTSQYNSVKKVLLNRTYHRYFLCADARNPPHCFGLVTTTMAQTHQLVSNVADESFVGLSFYLVEPNITTSKMGKYLPVLTCEDDALIPLKPEDSSVDKASHIELPSGLEETYYFELKNRKIKMSRIKSPHDVSCTGVQCDRQKKKGECICIQFAPGFPLVYTFDIKFDVDPKVMNGETTHVSTFRSFRTTEVFFRNFTEYSSTTTFDRERHMQQKRRHQMSRMVEYINNNGGWKLIGWCKKGELAIEGEVERVESSDVKLHLSYVYPSNTKIFEDEEFKKLRIYDDFNEVPTLTSDSRDPSTETLMEDSGSLVED